MGVAGSMNVRYEKYIQNLVVISEGENHNEWHSVDETAVLE
jgi:hypothetical protein